MDVPSTRTAKVSVVNLPQEYELERFVRDVENPYPSWSVDTAACMWGMVQCDDSGQVRNINFWGKKLLGQLNLKYLPKSILKFSAGMNRFTGEAHLDSLPPLLSHLDLCSNGFIGSLELASLPSDMVELILYKNKFSGDVCLSSLPGNLKILDLGNNALTGAVDLEHLSSSMVELMLKNNEFSGPVCLERLPRLKELNLSNNKFTGTPAFVHLPQTLRVLLLYNNQFEGFVKLNTFPRRLKYFELHGNLHLFGEIYYGRLPDNMKSLEIDWTNFKEDW